MSQQHLVPKHWMLGAPQLWFDLPSDIKLQHACPFNMHKGQGQRLLFIYIVTVCRCWQWLSTVGWCHTQPGTPKYGPAGG